MAHILGTPKIICQGIPNFLGVTLFGMDNWNARLKFAREKAGIRPTDLAKEVGVSNATVSDWESGEIKKLEGGNMLKVCNLLNISPNWLIFGRGEMKNEPLSNDDHQALKINRALGVKERRAWYRVGDSLAEPTAGGETEPKLSAQ